MICVPLTLGVWIRVRVPNFLAADLSFEATILMGLLLGPVRGACWAARPGAFPRCWHGEYWTLPVNLAVAAIAGGFWQVCRARKMCGRSRRLIDLSLYQLGHAQPAAAAARPPDSAAGADYGDAVRHQHAVELLPDAGSSSCTRPDWLVELAICACAPVVVGIPLKIWNAIRIERKLEEQSRLLMEARLDALQRQINPHFLFNTLNSIASLVRSQPELAREMIVKLANILRVLLKDREAFVPFREELAFTDDYLDIEVVRFGEKLRVVKEIAEETLPVVVPSMLLQPLIENSIKHGLEPRIGGGTVTLRCRWRASLLLEVEDDGIGMEPGRT